MFAGCFDERQNGSSSVIILKRTDFAAEATRTMAVSESVNLQALRGVLRELHQV
jgi:hypothetical protein